MKITLRGATSALLLKILLAGLAVTASGLSVRAGDDSYSVSSSSGTVSHTPPPPPPPPPPPRPNACACVRG